MCCSPWGRKESDSTERLNRNSNNRGVQTKKFGLARAPAVPARLLNRRRRRESWLMKLAHDLCFR